MRESQQEGGRAGDLTGPSKVHAQRVLSIHCTILYQTTRVPPMIPTLVRRTRRGHGTLTLQHSSGLDLKKVVPTSILGTIMDLR